MKLFILFTICLIFTCPNCLTRAEILNVPDDYETIQEAIHESEDGDSVLVQPGIYTENITFEGKGITVASLIIMTGYYVLVQGENHA